MTGQTGDFSRRYNYPALGPLLGYTDPVYGQAGLEASLDNYLRGLQGYPTLTTWWDHLLYGQPPPGLDVSLSLDENMQAKADELLQGHKGALVLMNAHTGEILSMASSPSFDANQLGSSWEELLDDPDAPLYNRAAMGLYPAGNALGMFLLASTGTDPASEFPGTDLTGCAVTPEGHTWGDMIAAGCGGAIQQLADAMPTQELIDQLDKLGFYSPPAFPVETLSSSKPGSLTDAFTYLTGVGLPADPSNSLRVSPLQMALAAASLSNAGERPAPRLVMGVDTPISGWVSLPADSQPVQALSAVNVKQALEGSLSEQFPIWQLISSVSGEPSASETSNQLSSGYSWYLGGTSPD